MYHLIIWRPCRGLGATCHLGPPFGGGNNKQQVELRIYIYIYI